MANKKKNVNIQKEIFILSFDSILPILQPHNLMRTHNCIYVYVYIDTPYTNITGSIDINQDNFFARAVVLRKYCIVCISICIWYGHVHRLCRKVLLRSVKLRIFCTGYIRKVETLLLVLNAEKVHDVSHLWTYFHTDSVFLVDTECWTHLLWYNRYANFISQYFTYIIYTNIQSS